MEEDPKIVARNEVSSKQTQDLLRQFTNLDGPKGTSAKFREAWDRMHEAPTTLKHPVKCSECKYVAETLRELEWHEEQAGHDFPEI